MSILEIETAQQLDTGSTRQVCLVTLDVGSCAMSDNGLLQTLACVHRWSAKGPIMLLTSIDESTVSDAMIADVRRFGVRGYVSTDTPVEIALAAFRMVIAGGIYFPRSLAIDCRDWEPVSATTLVSLQAAATLNGEAVHVPAIVDKANVSFTERERQVLATLLRGMSNKVIANELNLSQNTVKSHISRIMHKLHARNRTEAVILSQHTRSATNGGATDTLPQL